MSDLRKYGFTTTTPVQKAWEIFIDKLRPLPLDAVNINVAEGLNRVLAEDIYSDVDIPEGNRSAVDGYCVRGLDTTGASQLNPRYLKIVSKFRIDTDPTDVSLEAGTAIQVATGSLLPANCDAVVMIEDTRKIDAENIEVYKPVAPWVNVIKQGEDVKKGSKIATKGAWLYPSDLGLLLSAGYSEIPVVRKPKVAILACGSELVNLTESRAKGKIYESNRVVLSNYIRLHGCEPIDLGIVEDDLDVMIQNIQRGLELADIVLTTGGTSVGIKDYAVDAASRIGEVVIHGVSIRPGMPLALSIVKGKPLISLSGNPVAAVAEYFIFVRKLLQLFLGMADNGLTTIRAKIDKRIPSRPGMQSFVRIGVYTLKNELFANPIRTRGSGLLSSLTQANGFILIPEEVEGIEEGEWVTVYLLRPIKGENE